MILSIIIVRSLLLALSLCLLFRTSSAIWIVFRGSQSLAQTARAAQGFMALACILGQLFYLFYQTPIALLAALMIACIGIGLFIRVSQRARRKRMLKLDCLIDNPQWSLPLVELGEVDAAMADMLAHEARQALAQRRAR